LIPGRYSAINTPLYFAAAAAIGLSSLTQVINF